MTAVIQVKRGTAAAWTSANTVLAAGEVAFETDTKKIKIGDGSTAWNSLGYIVTEGDIFGVTAGSGLTGGGTSGTVTLAIDTSSVSDLSSSQTLSNKTLTSPIINIATSTPSFSSNSYTLVASDSSKLLLASNSSTAGTVNIPTNSSVPFAVGTQISLVQTGSGQLTISATTPATTTILSTGSTAASPKCRAQYSAATLVKTATDTWYVFGDIT